MSASTLSLDSDFSLLYLSVCAFRVPYNIQSHFFKLELGPTVWCIYIYIYITHTAQVSQMSTTLTQNDTTSIWFVAIQTETLHQLCNVLHNVVGANRIPRSQKRAMASWHVENARHYRHTSTPTYEPYASGGIPFINNCSKAMECNQTDAPTHNRPLWNCIWGKLLRCSGRKSSAIFSNIWQNRRIPNELGVRRSYTLSIVFLNDNCHTSPESAYLHFKRYITPPNPIIRHLW